MTKFHDVPDPTTIIPDVIVCDEAIDTGVLVDVIKGLGL